MFNYFSSILYVTFDARGFFSLMRILRGSSEVKMMHDFGVAITLQARHITSITKVPGHLSNN